MQPSGTEEVMRIIISSESGFTSGAVSRRGMEILHEMAGTAGSSMVQCVWA